MNEKVEIHEERIARGQYMEDKKLSISNNAVISAIYFALLQCGYDFFLSDLTRLR